MKNRIRTRIVLLCLMQALVVFFTYGHASAKTISVSVTPSKLAPMPGEPISITVTVNLAGTVELLGALSAKLTWNPEALRYIDHHGATAPSYAKMIVNDKQSAEGQLLLAGFNPHGDNGQVTVLAVNFEVIGTAGADPGIQLEIKEMVAAKTFVDLMPYLENTITGVKGLSIMEIPKEYQLHQNHPNPFNAGTEIRFELPRDGHVRLIIYNLLGEQLRTLVDEDKKVGRYNIHWDGLDSNRNPVSSGIYLYRMEAGSFKAQKRMLYVK
jgi:hypothetical protein